MGRYQFKLSSIEQADLFKLILNGQGTYTTWDVFARAVGKEAANRCIDEMDKIPYVPLYEDL